jgi:esterase/lipase superfamily enzyme
MALILIVLLLALLLGGLGFAIHILWWIALIVLVVWVLGFVIRVGEGGSRRRWYRWLPIHHPAAQAVSDSGGGLLLSLPALNRHHVRVNREMTELWSAALGAAGTVIRYGHWGRPVLVFPTARGRAWDFENHGMVGAVADLIDAGRLKLYCVDSYDAASWSDHEIPLEERARRHGRYESWIVGDVVPWIYRDCGGPAEVITLGCSMGAFHAANFTLKRADLFPLAMCFSGNYDPAGWDGWGERANEAYFNNPMDYVANLEGDHLEWLRSQVSLLLVCGQGRWEDTTGALASTRKFAALLAEKGIRHELDLWGHDVPHDWPSWRAQVARHMPRFV